MARQHQWHTPLDRDALTCPLCEREVSGPDLNTFRVWYQRNEGESLSKVEAADALEPLCRRKPRKKAAEFIGYTMETVEIERPLQMVTERMLKAAYEVLN